MNRTPLRHSLKGKLLLAGMLLQTMLMLTLYLVVTQVLRESSERALMVSAKTISQSVNLSVAPYAFERRFSVLHDFFSEMIADSEDGLRYIVILDEKHQVLLSVGLHGQTLPAASGSAAQAMAEGVYHVSQPVLLSGNQVGEVHFGVATADMSAVLHTMLNIALGFSLAGLIITGGILMFFGQRLQQRLDQITQAMQDIVAGNYARRAPEQGRDELAYLSRQFNLMVSAVEARDKKFSGVLNAAPLPMALYCMDTATRQLTQIDRNLAATRSFGRYVDDPASPLPYVSLLEKEFLMEQLRTRLALPPQEIDMILADGSRHPFMLYAESFYVDEQRYSVVVAMDIHDLRETQNRLHELNTELEQRVQQRTAELAEKNLVLASTLSTLQQTQEKLIQSEKLSGLGRMVAGVAHELNTPLGSALTVVSSILDKQQEFEAALANGLRKSTLQHYLDESRLAGQLLTKNIERAASLVTSFKAIVAQEQHIRPGLVALDTLLQRVLHDTQAHWQGQGVTLKLKIAADLDMTCAADVLYRVLVQLLENALQHGLIGVAVPELAVSAEVVPAANAATPEKVRITVSDNGCGIRPEDLRRIFDPFFTTRLGQGNTGLGLHMVYNLVSSVLDGEISVQSQPGAGASFILLLPRHQLITHNIVAGEP